MAYLRFQALKRLSYREKKTVKLPDKQLSSFFAEDTFTMEKMRETLSPVVYQKISEAIKRRKKIDKETADAVASSVKIWAINKHVTHFTHWFQPLTGGTAEKHDAFFDAMSGIEKFQGVELLKQEPDASSFPSGGIRSTFEARGYTVWDPTSPIFIYGKTLCIPTIFVSYTGETLDTKSPLLKALKAVDKAATRVCKMFDKNVHHVIAMLGCEQEYFIVDKSLYMARPDLLMTGRTVFGHVPARSQQLEDHYFGSIAPRIYDFMQDFEMECWHLGIPLRTRHNEVAPSQFEVAPLFEEVNIANDHNQLLMDVMRRVADRHRLKVLFHEKPFSGFNGNGKHNNWSLVTDTGVNLFAPSSAAKNNLRFLTFLIVTIKAISEHTDLLRASVATAGNDLRLGASEAPPAIMSIFLGDQITSLLDELEKKGNTDIKKGDNLYMKLGIDQIPEIILDAADRNRTSPFAFTGNKFEFRAIGASDNSATAMTALNLIMADQLTQFYHTVDEEIKKGVERRLSIVKVLRRYVKESKFIRFEGDGYAKKWCVEAAHRGLSNIDNMPCAIDAYLSKKSIQVFKKFKVLSHQELIARQNIKLENYVNKIDMEAKVICDMAINNIISTAMSYQNKLIKNAKGLKELDIDNSAVIEAITEINQHIKSIKVDVLAIRQAQKEANTIRDIRKRAITYCNTVKRRFDVIRSSVDALEMLVEDEQWPLVKYRELLFMK